MGARETSIPSPGIETRGQARAAGLAYLVTIAAGMFAEIFVRAPIRREGAVGAAARLNDLEQLYRVGVLADGIMLVSYVVVTAMLYRLFKRVDATASFLAALFSLIGIAM